MPIAVCASEVLRLTVEDIGQEILVEIKDQENQNEEHVAHLRELVRQRAQKARSQAVDAVGLVGKLRLLPSRESSPSSRSRSLSRTPVINEEEERKENLCKEKEAYDALVADGGRGSHPISLGFDVLDNPGKYKDILWFWHFNGEFQGEFRHQLMVWENFRKFQETVRRFYVKRDRFHEYENAIRESQEALQCKWDIKLHEERHNQDRLEDWNEFRAFYYRKLKACEKNIEPAMQKLLPMQKGLEDAKARLTDAIVDRQVLFDRLGDIITSKRVRVEAISRVESAEKTLQATNLDKSKRARERATLIKTAQQDLHSAKASLECISGSEEMRRLRDGSQLAALEDCVISAKHELDAALLEVKRWMVFLKWIDDQYSAIAAECGYHADVTVPDMSPSLHLFSRSQKSGPGPRQRRCTQTRSVLSPNSSSKILKRSKHKSNLRHKVQIISPDILPPTTIQNPVERPIPTPWSERLRQSKPRRPAQGPGMASLGPVHSSKVTKTKATLHTMKPDIKSGRSTTELKPRTKRSPTSKKSDLRRSQRLIAQFADMTDSKGLQFQ